MMLNLRITAPDGQVRTVPLHGPEVMVGRAPNNNLVLEGNGVSSLHCAFIIQGSRCTLHDRGSTNGTYVNNQRVQQSDPLRESDTIYVGQYLLQLQSRPAARSVHPSTIPESDTPAPVPGIGGRILIQREDRAWRDQYNRWLRYAEQWVHAGRPDRLALRPHELRRANLWLSQTPPSLQATITPAQRELIAFSRGANSRIARKRALMVLGGFVAIGGLWALALYAWPDPPESPEPSEPEPPAEVQASPQTQPQPRRKKPTPKTRTSTKTNTRIKHTVIPAERIDEVAQRYGVSVAQIAEWNFLNPDDPLRAGDILKIKKPTKRPLPQQKIIYEVEPEDGSLTGISERFGVTAKKLRDYNPDIEDVHPGQNIVIWIDPRPYKPREPKEAIPEYVPDQTALAVGSPNSGSLVNGIELPDNPDLYKRRYPYIMYGSGYLVANVQKAAAQFRQDMDFDGTLVMADISKRNGGNFYPPHRSHQAGRDIDIWLPTLRGVFKEKYLTDDGEEKWGRRPNPEEVDWFATWGLIKALLDTDAVQVIFLSESVQPRIYDAAVFLGTTEEELDRVLQWPRGEGEHSGLVVHEAGHSHHMHVRFKCAPYERDCSRQNTRNP